MHYYQHHIGDFMRDTANLNDHQLATYLRMLWAYYDSELPIRGDFEDIAFAMRSDDKTVRLLLRHYFKEAEDGWHHSRCDKEIADYHAKAEKARNSANARWGNANGMRTHSDRKATATVSDANQEPITNKEESPKGDLPSAAKPAAADPCPHQEIIDLYHELCPAGRQVREWTPARAQTLRTRWREKPARQSIEWWRRFFGYVSESDFLMGRVIGKDGRSFEVSLDWLIAPKNFVKVIEGTYHNQKENA